MARYPRRRSYRRSRRSSRLRPKNIKRNTSARSQSKQITALARQVKQLNKKSTQWAQWYVPYMVNGNTSHAFNNGEFHVCNLVQPNLWTAIFQTNAIAGATPAQAPNKCKMVSLDMQFMYTPSDSEEALTPRVVDMWVVKLRKETAMDVLVQTNNMSIAGLNAGTVNNNIVVRTDTDGGLETMVKWNPVAFKILAHRQCTIANIMQETAVPENDVSVTNTRDALRRFRVKIKLGNELKPATGTFKEMEPDDVMPNDRYYIIHHIGGFDSANEENGVTVDTNFVLNTQVYV